MVFYLKYRPQKIQELDSEAVRERLLKILSSNSVPHAFLFTGPKGLGKTSAARIVAKSINCTKRNPSAGSGQEKSAEPCGKCSSCVAITNGTNLDVLEIDAASNRGIDEIRDLREKIRLAPASSLKKVYIIDEVHMLTPEAFNALLKTLEEPPEHALFVLCTTEPQKLPETIISRCLHIAFKPPTDEEMKRSLRRVAKGEGLQIDDEGFAQISKLSSGSFRDGAKILEEIAINFGKRKVSKKQIEEFFNVETIKDGVRSLIASLSEKDVKKSLQIVENLKKHRVDLRLFLEDFLSFVHSLVLTSYGVGDVDENLEFLKKMKIEASDLKKIIETFSNSYAQIKSSPAPQIPIEIAILEYITADTKDQEDGLQTQTSPTQPNDGKIFRELIEKINERNKSIAALLRGVRIDKEDDSKITFTTSYKFHKERLEDPKSIELIESVYKEISGKKKMVAINLRGGD